jgi:hypothetical protein
MSEKLKIGKRTIAFASAVLVLVYLAVLPIASAQSTSNTSTTIQSTLCGIISTISSVIFIIAIFMFVLGSILYGVAHMFPAAGNLKGSTQGWGIGMIIGGIIAIVLYLLSSFIITHLAALSNNGVIPAISQQGCSGVSFFGSTVGSTSSASGVQNQAGTSSSSFGSSVGTGSHGTGSQSTSSGSSTSTTPISYIAGIGGNTAGGSSNPQNSYAKTGPNGIFLENGNFSSGSYSGWTTSGPGFSGKPTEINVANQNGDYYKNPWSNYGGEFFATTYRQNSTYQPGNLTSSQFEVTEPYLNFNIISAGNSGSYVAILIGNTPFLIQHYNTSNGKGINGTDTFANASINLSSLYGKNISVEVVSQTSSSTSKGAFTAVGDFRQSNTSIATPGILVNSTIV